MRPLLFLAPFLLVSGTLSAQLYVSPNTTSGSDSYIYANDAVLYVEQDIELVENTNAETKASIYFRGDAQLIQGDKLTSQNSGNGSISILQRGWANAYDYNYWGSPVGVPEGVAGNKNFGITRFFDVQDGGTHPTHSLQQETTGALNGLSNPLRISSRWIYALRGSNSYYGWVYIANSNGILPGEGFSMKGTRTDVDAHDQLYDFRGRPNDGDISITVSHNGTEGLSTLVGNPYPSAIDLAAFIFDNTAIEGQALFWDQDRTTNTHYIYDYEGGYGIWVPAGGDDIGDGTTSGTYTNPVYTYTDGYGTSGTPTGEVGEYVERRFAPVGQGFVVLGDETIGPGNGTVTFKNSMRRHIGLGAENFSQFKSQTNSSNKSNISEYYLDIMGSLRFHIGIDENYVRDMVLMFSDESTNGIDRGYDGSHPGIISSGDAYWKLEDVEKPYVIQTRPYDFHSKIPLGVKVKNGANYFEVSLVEIKGFDNIGNLKLFLFDAFEKTYQKLDLNNKALINHSGAGGVIEDRYFIVFKKGHHNNGQNNGNGNKNISALDFFQNNRAKQLEVYNPETIDIKSAYVYDMSGKTVIQESNLGKQTKYSFSTANLSSGVYLVKLITVDDIIIDYKVTVHNK
ncbi:T9SS type A sorting domain-containing protein [Planktosalinus lacus]|nr:T9SS type A sorting domain-containing protein [Planktosalinus lacus]